MIINHLGLISIEGAGAKALLQGQLTCHMDEVSLTQSRLAAHCSPKGRIISLFRIWQHPEGYLLQMPISLLSIAIKALQKYAPFFKATLRDVTQEYTQEGTIDSSESGLITDSVQQNNEETTIQIPGKYARSIKITKGKNHVATTDSTWQRIDIESMIPAIYEETTETFLPHELNLPNLNAISFNKGCYTGQEIIARMHYRGKQKTQLRTATFNTTLLVTRGSDLYSDQKQVVGSLVDYVKINEHQYDALIFSEETDTIFLDASLTTQLDVSPWQKN